MTYEIRKIATGEVLASFGSREGLDTWVRSQDWTMLNSGEFEMVDTDPPPPPVYLSPEGTRHTWPAKDGAGETG